MSNDSFNEARQNRRKKKKKRKDGMNVRKKIKRSREGKKNYFVKRKNKTKWWC